MNPIFKHSILFLLSLALLFSMTFFLRMPANNEAELANIGFGFPFEYVAQDFSEYNQGITFFPRYQSFEIKRDILHFNFVAFVGSLLAIFLSVEVLVKALENIHYFTRKFIINSRK